MPLQGMGMNMLSALKTPNAKLAKRALSMGAGGAGGAGGATGATGATRPMGMTFSMPTDPGAGGTSNTKDLARRASAPLQMGPGTNQTNQALDRYGRSRYGFSEDLQNKYLGNLFQSSMAMGQGMSNQMMQQGQQRGMGQNLSGMRTAGQAGFDMGNRAYSQALIPAMFQSAQFAEGQRNADVGFGQGLYNTQVNQEMQQRQLMAQMYAKPKEYTNIPTPFGTLSI